MARGKLLTFGQLVPERELDGVYGKDGWIVLRQDGTEECLLPLSAVRLRGEHNLLNVLAACAIGKAAGFSKQALQAGIEGFEGVAHRLEFVRRWGEADWYNDSIATAPERAMAAIRSFAEPLILLAGGRDKNLPWEDFASLVRRRVDHLVVFGEATEKIAASVEAAPAEEIEKPLTIVRCSDLREAVRQAAELVKPGYVVLLSPGGTSFDEFYDFEVRGEVFKKWVMELQ
jgi:UDP-N-acetylmuramoylalanine--D-glutamate ligase